MLCCSDNLDNLPRLVDQNSDVTESESKAFCLLLKRNKSLRISPKKTLDIPLSFAPEDMRMFGATLTVLVTKLDRTHWTYICSGADGLVPR